MEEVIAEVDTKTGLSKCQFAISRLDYVDDRQVIMISLCVYLLVLIALYAQHHEWCAYFTSVHPQYWNGMEY